MKKSCCVYILHGVAAYILGGAINYFWDFEATLSADKLEKYSCTGIPRFMLLVWGLKKQKLRKSRLLSSRY